MANTQYVAFLRGINVGGNNIIKMADLKACLADAGFDDVTTYIQSGNVLLSGPAADPDTIADRVAKALAARFNYHAPIVLRSHDQIKAAVHGAPKGFGIQPDTFRSDVIFLKDPLTPAQVMHEIETIGLKEGVDSAAPGPDVVYFARLTAKASSSHLTRVITLPIYKNMTIRNWNTTTKILALLDAREAA